MVLKMKGAGLVLAPQRGFGDSYRQGKGIWFLEAMQGASAFSLHSQFPSVSVVSPLPPLLTCIGTGPSVLSDLEDCFL